MYFENKMHLLAMWRNWFLSICSLDNRAHFQNWLMACNHVGPHFLRLPTRKWSNSKHSGHWNNSVFNVWQRWQLLSEVSSLVRFAAALLFDVRLRVASHYIDSVYYWLVCCCHKRTLSCSSLFSSHLFSSFIRQPIGISGTLGKWAARDSQRFRTRVRWDSQIAECFIFSKNCSNYKVLIEWPVCAVPYCTVLCSTYGYSTVQWS